MEAKVSQILLHPLRYAFRQAGGEVVFNKLVAPYFRQASTKAAVAGVVATNAAVVYAGVYFNDLTGRFTNHMVERNVESLTSDALVFGVYATAVIGVCTARMLITEKMKLSWRNWARLELLKDWCSPQGRELIAAQSSKGLGNPEQRITDDVAVMVENSSWLTIEAARNVASAGAFSFVLWGVSPWLFAGAATISGLGIYASAQASKKLKDLDTQQMDQYNALRKGIADVSKHRNQIAAWGGEEAENSILSQRQQELARSINKSFYRRALVDAINSAVGNIAYAAPFLLTSPSYLAPNSPMAFGDVQRGSNAFQHLSGSLGWFAWTGPQRNYWAAGIKRLADFMTAQEDSIHADVGKPNYVSGQEPRLRVKELDIGVHGLAPLCRNVSFDLRPGDRLALTGPSGCGKSTFLCMLIGANPIDTGTIDFVGVENKPGQVVVMPQAPYIPDMPLRQILSYPASTVSFTDEEMARILSDVGLNKLAQRLDDTTTLGSQYIKQLSGGEQQRLGFARLLLHKPKIIGLDEATSALPEKDGLDIHKILFERLPKSIIISVFHRPELRMLHSMEGRFSDQKLIFESGVHASQSTPQVGPRLPLYTTSSRGPLWKPDL